MKKNLFLITRYMLRRIIIVWQYCSSHIKCSDRIGYLDEKLYRNLLWNHKSITDFWQVAKGIARRLEKYGIYDMQGVANCSSDRLYKEFGINAEPPYLS